MSICDYRSASEYLGRKTDRPLEGRSSRLVRRDDSTIAVRYHATDVVTYRADNTIVLQTGGWYSVTTKARMNEYAPARIYTDKGIWYMGGDWNTPREKRPIFYDGVTLRHTGEIINPKYPTLSESAAKRALDRKVSTYVKGFAQSIADKGLADPSNGDCFGCLFQVQGAPEVTQGTFRLNRPTPHGRVEPMGADHYLSHFEESYFVPSLLFNAIKARGYRDPGFIWHTIKGRKDGAMAARILRQYFKNLKPELYRLSGSV